MNNLIPVQTMAVHSQDTETLFSAEYLLILALSEGVVLQEREEMHLPAGTLLFVSPFSNGKLVLRPNTKALYAVISAAFLEPMLGPPKRAAVVVQSDGTNTAKEKLIELFDLQYNARTATNLAKMQTAMELLCALEPAISNETVSALEVARKNDRISQVTAYIDTNFRQPIQLGDLARNFAVSRQYISTLLHKELGIPFSEYLLGLRLKEAVRLLLTTDKSITEVAENSGFPNLKSFNQAFRAKYQATPKEYRQSKLVPVLSTLRNNTLNDINQLLRPHRLVYKKNEEAVRISDVVDATAGVPMTNRWDIINVDNCYECLQTDVQDSLTMIQEKLQFRYVRLCNVLCHEMTPFIPLANKHRFTSFYRLIGFFRGIGLTPMLSLGDSYVAMPDAVMVSDDAYSRSLPEWLALLEELLKASVSRWGAEWVDTWRFEFHMPERLYGSENYDRFCDLFEESYKLIRTYLPEAEIGGPSLSLSKDHISRWEAWFRGLRERNLRPDFISMELWADYTFTSDRFRGQHDEWKDIRTISQIRNADTALAIQKVQSVKRMMAQNGLDDVKFYISAFGVTKYRATAAQVGGHCSAYLVKCLLELNDIADGIGCWKALNNEAEYQDENMVFSNGCGMLSRHKLKNLNFYAYSFLTGLMPYKLFQGLHTIVTTDNQGNYAVLIHNCKNYSEYFCRHYTDQAGLQFSDPRLYTSNVALEQTVTLEHVSAQEYMFKQFLIGDHHGCIASVLLQMGRVRRLDAKEIEYVSGQSLPYQHAFTAMSQGELQFTVTLQPNEAMLLHISPENGICYF